MQGRSKGVINGKKTPGMLDEGPWSVLSVSSDQMLFWSNVVQVPTSVSSAQAHLNAYMSMYPKCPRAQAPNCLNLLST